MSAKHRGWLAIIGIPIVVILGISTPANAQCGNGATVDVELAVPTVNLKIRELRLQQLQYGLELSQAYAELDQALAATEALVAGIAIMASLAVPPAAGLTAAQTVALNTNSLIGFAKNAISFINSAIDATR